MTRKTLKLPYVIFMLLFVVAPLWVLFYYAFTDKSGSFSLDNLFFFFSDANMLGTLFYSLVIALTTTVICLLIAYPTAYLLATAKNKSKSVMILIIVAPMWINFSLRISALREILSLVQGNIALYPFFNSVLGMVYDFLPFMILPIYNTLLKLDNNLIEAARDLGAGKGNTFLQITLPLSRPGIISGVMMVFLPSMTNYVVLDMLYNSTYIMGSLIGGYFNAYNWHMGSLVALILLTIISLFSVLTGDKEESKGGVLL